MIVIKIELWPLGFESRAREIGRMTLTNDGTSEDPKRGNYTAKVMRRGTIDKVQRTARVEDYPRQSYSIWELVRRALNTTYGKT